MDVALEFRFAAHLLAPFCVPRGFLGFFGGLLRFPLRTLPLRALLRLLTESGDVEK